VTSINKAVTEYGFKEDEIIGKNMLKFVPKKYWPKLLQELAEIARGNPVEGEIELITPKGKKIAEYRSNPIRQGKKVVGFQTILRDVTERKRMEEKLKEYAEHLEEKVKERTRELEESQKQLLKSEKLAAIGEVATMVGHDLRNPLQSIENATYYLNNELLRLSPTIPIPQKVMEMLQVITDSVNYADRIIRDLQDFSAMKRPVLKKADVNAIVKETLSQVETPANVELITELGHLPKIKVDKDMIKRVFLNLALNGIQAMENGGTLKVSTKKTKGFVEVSFKDTGVGISRENIEKLFTPFFTTKAKGLGMGLAICKKFVDAHSGTIEVESEEGKGTTFTVRLPTQQENGGEKPDEG
jgi:PAS domain S-box-containing protein